MFLEALQLGQKREFDDKHDPHKSFRECYSGQLTHSPGFCTKHESLKANPNLIAENAILRQQFITDNRAIKRLTVDYGLLIVGGAKHFRRLSRCTLLHSSTSRSKGIE
jgi:hypothetical protein